MVVLMYVKWALLAIIFICACIMMFVDPGISEYFSSYPARAGMNVAVAASILGVIAITIIEFFMLAETLQTLKTSVNMPIQANKTKSQ